MTWIDPTCRIQVSGCITWVLLLVSIERVGTFAIGQVHEGRRSLSVSLIKSLRQFLGAQSKVFMAGPRWLAMERGRVSACVAGLVGLHRQCRSIRVTWPQSYWRYFYGDFFPFPTFNYLFPFVFISSFRLHIYLVFRDFSIGTHVPLHFSIGIHSYFQNPASTYVFFQISRSCPFWSFSIYFWLICLFVTFRG